MTIPDLVTLEQAKMQLRIDDEEHDADIGMKIKQASHIVLDYLKYKEIPPLAWMVGSPAVMQVPPLVEAAVLLKVSELYHNRESSVINLISPAVVALLDRYRDPALA
jgi:hypothetical protein